MFPRLRGPLCIASVNVGCPGKIHEVILVNYFIRLTCIIITVNSLQADSSIKRTSALRWKSGDVFNNTLI